MLKTLYKLQLSRWSHQKGGIVGDHYSPHNSDEPYVRSLFQTRVLRQPPIGQAVAVASAFPKTVEPLPQVPRYFTSNIQPLTSDILTDDNFAYQNTLESLNLSKSPL